MRIRHERIYIPSGVGGPCWVDYRGRLLNRGHVVHGCLLFEDPLLLLLIHLVSVWVALAAKILSMLFCLSIGCH